MNVSEAQLSAIWCAARGVVPRQPIMNAEAPNAPVSNSNIAPAGTPMRSKLMNRAGSHAPAVVACGCWPG